MIGPHIFLNCQNHNSRNRYKYKKLEKSNILKIGKFVLTNIAKFDCKQNLDLSILSTFMDFFIFWYKLFKRF